MSKYFTSLFLVCIMIFGCYKATKAETTGSISGIVRDAVTQTPLSDVSISVSNGPTVTSNSSGEYTLADLVPQNYEVVASKNGYLGNTSNVNVVAGRTITKDIQMIPVTPELVSNISFVNFGTQQSSASVVLSNAGTGQVNWAATTDADWIQVNPQSGSITSGTTPVSLTANRTGLQPGNYSTTVLFTSNVNSVSIAVLLTVSNPSNPMLTVAPTSLDFGFSLEELSLSLVNNGSGTAIWSVSTNQSWIRTNPTSGDTTNETDIINVTVSRTGMNAGTYNGFITIYSDETQIIIPVEMEVATQPSLSISPNNLDFGTEETSLPLRISNLGGGNLEWSISSNVQWLSIAPSSGTDNEIVTIAVNRQGLDIGTYNDNITIESNGGRKTVPVTMSVQSVMPDGVTLLQAFIIDQSSAQLNWSRYVDAGFVSYRVYRGTTPDVNHINGTLVTELTVANETSFVISNLLPETEYYLCVYVKNQQNQMIPSTNILSVTTPPAIGNWYVALTSLSLTGLDFLHPNFGMAVGSSGIYSYSGGVWTQENSLNSKQVAVIDATNIYTNKHYYNGISWEELPFTYGESVIALDNNDVWIGGTLGRMNHYNGTSWELIQLNCDTIRAIKALSSDLIYAVDRFGKVLKNTGAGWTEIYDFALPNHGNISYEFISSMDVKEEGELWITYYKRNASGEDLGGKVFHFSNDVFQQEWTLNHGVKCVSILANNDVWFGGKSGQIWHFDGQNFLQVNSSCSFEINNIIMIDKYLGWAVGYNGILKYVLEGK